MQNNLTFVGAAHLSVVAFQATNQLRIPATALVATLVLGQDIGRRLALSLSLSLTLTLTLTLAPALTLALTVTLTPTLNLTLTLTLTL